MQFDVRNWLASVWFSGNSTLTNPLYSVYLQFMNDGQLSVHYASGQAASSNLRQEYTSAITDLTLGRLVVYSCYQLCTNIYIQVTSEFTVSF